MTSSILNRSGNTQAALQESDTQAFRRMLADMTKPNTPLDGFVYENIAQDSQDPARTTLQVRIVPAQAPISQWGYQDSLELNYRRVALPAVLARYGDVVRTDLPTSVRAMMQAYFSAAGLYDRSEQFMDEPIESLGLTTISVIPEQFLLYGQGEIEVKARQRQLTEVLPNRLIQGFRGTPDFDANVILTFLEQLTALNEDTLPYPLQPEWVSFGHPTVLGGYAHDNTRVVLTAFGEGFYIGEADITYSRLDFGWYTIGSQIFIEGPPQPTLEHILDQVSSQTGFPLHPDDVEAQVFDPVEMDTVTTLTVFFKPDNLRYVGELTVDYKAV